MRLAPILPALCVLLAAAAGRAAPVKLPALADVSVQIAASELVRSEGLDPRTTFEPVASFATPEGGRLVRLQQRFAGVDVQGGIVTLRLGARGLVERTVSGVVHVAAVPTTPRLTAAEAFSIARQHVRAPLPVEHRGRARLVVSRAYGGRLAWDVYVEPAVALWSPHVIVDATTGEVLGQRDAALHTGQAKVFPDAAAAATARKTDGSFNPAGLATVTLGGVVPAAAGENVLNADLVAYNCCPNEGCDTAKPAKQLKLEIPIGVANLKGDVAICDERPWAAADEAGDFLYTPPTEPTSDTDAVPGPSETDDRFGEVQAFHFAERTLAYFRTLDPQLELREESRPLRITTNVLFPDFQEAIEHFDLATYSTYTTRLVRVDNAAFIPSGASLGGVPIEGLSRPFDSVVFFQGKKSDFAYDADVVSHEFGHAVVESSGGLGGYSADVYGALPASGSMNEGLADYFAAARTNDARIGDYVGDLAGTGEGALRDLTNDLKCPSVIRGEVHSDSQHFSAALWAARTLLGTDAATRLAYDQAVLTALRGLTENPSFELAAGLFEDEVARAFPTNGREVLTKEFTDRGVIGCVRITPLTEGTELTGYQIAPASRADGFANYGPGPVQFQLTPPAGASALEVNVTGSAGGGLGIDLPFGGFGQPQGPQLQAELKVDTALEFTYSANRVSSNADELKPFLAGTEEGTAYTKFTSDFGCGDRPYFLALESLAQAGAWNVEKLSITWKIDADRKAACAPAPTPDAGTPADAGSEGSGGDTHASGCDCQSTGPALALAAVGLLTGLRRRVRR